MIITYAFRFGPKLRGHDGPGIANISNVYNALCNEQDYCTTTRSIFNLLDISLHKFCFSHATTIFDCSHYVQGELRLRCYDVVQLVSKKFSAALTTMPVENSKKLNLFLRLLRVVWLKTRLLQIKNDRNPVFIVIPENSIVSVGSITNEVRVLSLLCNFSLFNDRSRRKYSHWRMPSNLSEGCLRHFGSHHRR